MAADPGNNMEDCKAIEDFIKSVLFKNELDNSTTGALAQQSIVPFPEPLVQSSNHIAEQPFQSPEHQEQLKSYYINSHPVNSSFPDYIRMNELGSHYTKDGQQSSSSRDGNSHYSPAFYNELCKVAVDSPSHPDEKGRLIDVQGWHSAVDSDNQAEMAHPDLVSRLLEESDDSNNTKLAASKVKKKDLDPSNSATTSNVNHSPSLDKDKKKKKSKEKTKLKKVKKEKKEKSGGARARKIQMQAESDDVLPKYEDVGIPFREELNHEGVLEYAVVRSKQGKWTFYCEVCDHNSTEESQITKHMDSPTHKEKVKRAKDDLLLAYLPEPVAAQIEVVDGLIKKTAAYGLPEKSIIDRKAVAARVNQLVSKYLPDCSVDLVGSSVTGLGLQTSEVDLILKVPLKCNAADMLASTFEILQEDQSHYMNVTKEFREKIPRIQFEDVDQKLRAKCSLTIDTGNAAKFTKLMQFYASLDARVITLGKAFRFWAAICELDKPEQSTLPSICYPLLLVYFLQQEKPPVLPVLDEEIGPKILEIPDFETFQKSFRWKSKNDSSVGLLWIKLMQFYSVKYQPGKDVVCIRSSKKVTCRDQRWGTKFYAIEDPIARRNLAHVIPNRAVYQYIHGCFMNTYRHFGYLRIKGCGEVKLATRDTPSSSRLNYTLTLDTSTTLSGDALSQSTDILDDDLNDLMNDTDPDLCFDDVVSTISKMSIPDTNRECAVIARTSDKSDLRSAATARCTSADSHASSRSMDLSSGKAHNGGVLQENISVSQSSSSTRNTIYYWDIGAEKITVDDVDYHFNSNLFKENLSLPVICRLCLKTGHLKMECPSERLPPILPLKPMTKEFLHILNDVCFQIRNQNKPTPEELSERQHDLYSLHDCIRSIYPDAVLEMFGSFCNGFGFTKSDVDFCLTFHDDDGKSLDPCKIIENLATKLKKNGRYVSVIPITSAKVPIVKLFDRKSGLENDISLYNTLGQRNTKLLDTYCKIDQRLQILGYVLKYFAKTLDICDASRGSLSSYAYILMAIFFLQQREPPVLPVLQQLFRGSVKPVDEVDGWNAWFFDDISQLPKVWPDHNKNKETVGELWLGLLNFYAKEFNMDEFVIAIKQKEPLTRFRKLWNSERIAIEDPFDLNHNLGSGLSRKMSNFIMKAFISGREHFGTPVTMSEILRINSNGPLAFLFDRRVLNQGCEPPKDRGCRFCGKIGHVVKDCTAKRNINKKKERMTYNKRRGAQLKRNNHNPKAIAVNNQF